MTERTTAGSSTALEPAPGQWLSPEDYAAVVRLTPLVAIDLVVRSPDGRVLVGRRINEPAKGMFFIPGGRITKNETREAAFRRLTLEELGVEVGLETARLIGVYEHMYSNNRFGVKGFGTHYIVLAYELNLALDPGTMPKDQHAEYVWLTPTALVASPEVHENTKAYFRET
jgi:colanic acid biosynthesis protein WcaH